MDSSITTSSKLEDLRVEENNGFFHVSWGRPEEQNVRYYVKAFCDNVYKNSVSVVPSLTNKFGPISLESKYKFEVWAVSSHENIDEKRDEVEVTGVGKLEVHYHISVTRNKVLITFSLEPYYGHHQCGNICLMPGSVYECLIKGDVKADPPRRVLRHEDLWKNPRVKHTFTLERKPFHSVALLYVMKDKDCEIKCTAFVWELERGKKMGKKGIVPMTSFDDYSLLDNADKVHYYISTTENKVSVSFSLGSRYHHHHCETILLKPGSVCECMIKGDVKADPPCRALRHEDLWKNSEVNHTFILEGESSQAIALLHVIKDKDCEIKCTAIVWKNSEMTADQTQGPSKDKDVVLMIGGKNTLKISLYGESSLQCKASYKRERAKNGDIGIFQGTGSSDWIHNPSPLDKKITGLKAKLEGHTAIVTWKSRCKAFIVYVKEDDSIISIEHVPKTRFKWPCHPSRKYDFMVNAKDSPDSFRVASNLVYTDAEITDVEAKLEGHIAIVTWKSLWNRAFKVIVEENDFHPFQLTEEVVVKTRFKWHCQPSRKYKFLVNVKDAPHSFAVTSNSIVTAPSKIADLTLEEKESSVLVSWPDLEDEHVYYRIEVHSNTYINNEIRNKNDCSYELDFKKRTFQPGYYEFRVWAVSIIEGKKGEESVCTYHKAPSKIADLSVVERESSVYVSWPKLEDENVYYCVAVRCNNQIVDEVDNMNDCFYELHVKKDAIQAGSYEFKVWAVAKNGHENGEEIVCTLYIDAKIRDLKAEFESNKAVLTWRCLMKDRFEVQVKEDDSIITKKTVLKKKFEWECRPSCKYEFLVNVEDAACSDIGTSCSVYSAPSEIASLTLEEKESSVLASWPNLEDEDVYYCIEVYCNNHTIEEIHNKNNCFYELDFKKRIYQAASFKFKVWAVSKDGIQKGKEAIRTLYIDAKVREVKAVQEGNKAIVTWNCPLKHRFEVLVNENNSTIKKQTIVGRKFEWECSPSSKYEFLVSVEDATCTDIRMSNSVYTAPSKIADLTLVERESSVLVSWPKLEDENVYYCIEVQCNQSRIDKIEKKNDCSYELDFKKHTFPAGYYEFKIWAVSMQGKMKGEEIVHTHHIDAKIKDVRAELQSNKAIVTWKCLPNVRFEVEVKENDSIIAKQTVSGKKFDWLCRPSCKYEFLVKVEDAMCTDVMISNSVYTAPSKISELNLQERESSLVVSWPKLENEDVYYCVVIQCNNNTIDKIYNEGECSYELDFKKYAFQAGNYEFKVSAVSRNGDQNGEEHVCACFIDAEIRDVKAEFESDKAIVTWKCLLKHQFQVHVMENDSIIAKHVVSGREFKWLCRPSCDYQFLVNAEDVKRTDVVTLNPAHTEKIWSTDPAVEVVEMGNGHDILSNHNVTISVQHLCDKDKTGNEVVHITVSDETASNDDLSCMEKKLKTLTSKTLDFEFSDHYLTADHLSRLFDSTDPVKSKIRTLSFSYMKGIHGLIETICHIVKKDRIERLSLVFDDLGDESIDLLQKHLKEKKVDSLEALDISYNEDIGRAGYRRIGKIIRDCDIVSLKAIDCQITDQKLKNFFSELPFHDSKFKKLNIGRNTKVTSKGFRTVYEFVARNGLESLNLSGCNFSGETIDTFLQQDECEALNELDVSYNSIIETNASLASLVVHYRVIELNMAGCQINKDHLAHFTNLETSHKMKTMNMRDNKAIAACMTEIAELVKKFKLEELNIADCMLSADELQSFRKALNGYKLKRLQLGDHDRQLDEKYTNEIKILASDDHVEDKLYLHFYKLNNAQRSSLKNASKKVVLISSQEN